MRSLALVLALLLLTSFVATACGESGPDDPFVGTWRWESGDQPRWVISYADGEYTIHMAFPGSQRWAPSRHYVRSGDTLQGTRRMNEGVTLRRLDDDQLRLRIDDGSDLIKTATLTRLSTSTATPVPVP